MMFSNLSRLIDIQVSHVPQRYHFVPRLTWVPLQRRFLTCLETEYEPMVEKGGSAWIEGNWGYPFAHFVSARILLILEIPH